MLLADLGQRMILSVDPGKSSGWALWSEDGVLLEHGILLVDDMLELLQCWTYGPVSAVVFEEFRLDYRAAKQKGSSMDASQVIGALRLFARMQGAIGVAQRVESRDLGYAHAGMKKASRHELGHDRDAIAHGYWWLEANHIVPSLGDRPYLR